MKEIPLTKGFYAQVDDEDYNRVNAYSWCYCSGRAVRKYNSRNQQMPHFILGIPGSIILDHKDRNPLNNQKSNLRLCTRSQNAQNKIYPTGKSGYRGVISIKNKSCQWAACITVNKKRIHLGYYTDPVEAAQAYDIAALKHYDEFAVLNFPYGIII